MEPVICFFVVSNVIRRLPVELMNELIGSKTITFPENDNEGRKKWALKDNATGQVNEWINFCEFKEIASGCYLSIILRDYIYQHNKAATNLCEFLEKRERLGEKLSQ